MKVLSFVKGVNGFVPVLTVCNPYYTEYRHTVKVTNEFTPSAIVQIVFEYGVTKTFQLVAEMFAADKLTETVFFELLSELRSIIESKNVAIDSVIEIVSNKTVYREIISILEA